MRLLISIFVISAISASSMKALYVEREPQQLILTQAWLADAEESDTVEYLFIINGLLAFKTIEGLKQYIEFLPEGSSLTWAPGCSRSGNEPLLPSSEEMEDFRIFCEKYGIIFNLIPSG